MLVMTPSQETEYIHLANILFNKENLTTEQLNGSYYLTRGHKSQERYKRAYAKLKAQGFFSNPVGRPRTNPTEALEYIDNLLKNNLGDR